MPHVSLPRPAVLRAAAVAVLLAALLLPAARAHAMGNQVSVLEDDNGMLYNPVGTLDQLQALGVQEIRMPIRWQLVAPNANSKKEPKGFNAADPNAKGYNWTAFDTIVRDAAQADIGVSFDVMGGAPLWAAKGPVPSAGSSSPAQPSASQYGLFVRAVGTRYSGTFKPTGQSTALPRVKSWSIWNEPNYGPSLSPQGLPGHLSIDYSPQQYRNLVNAAWSALQRTGHGRDTIMFGELADRGTLHWGVNGGMTPGLFMRSLYCVGSNYRPLSGTAARERGCPTTAAASRRFRAQNPALFNATGVSDHPYMRWYAPNHEPNPDPYYHMSTADYSSLGTMGTFERILDRLQGAYGSHRHLPIFNTEFGYITSPPKRRWSGDKNPYVSTTTAAAYINQAEYLSYHSSRLATYMQYLLKDAFPTTRATDYGNFASGLLTYSGQPKPTYDAFRMPLYLPTTSTRRGRSLSVWGCVRPSRFAILDGQGAQTVQIQVATGTKPSSSSFKTVATARVSSSSSCYFTSHVTFPGSGSETVRLAWSYPTADPKSFFSAVTLGSTVYSRSVTIRLS